MSEVSDKALNLVQVGPDLTPSNGGIYKSTLQFSEVFDKSPIISFTARQEIRRGVGSDDGVRHLPLSKNRVLEWYGWCSKKEWLPAAQIMEEADLFCCNVMLRYHAQWLRKMARVHDRPYWYVSHGQLDPYVFTYRAGVKKLWLNLFGRTILKDAAHVIFATEQERKKAAWFYSGSNTRVVHWPVEFIDTAGKAEARDWVKQRLGLSQDSRVLLYLGRLHSMKNPLKTIEAIKESGEKKVHLALVGPDGDVTVDECKTYAKRLGVDAQIHVTGPIFGNDRDRFLLGADAFISLSHRENFGHTAAEAISAATPVILSPGNDLSPELAEYDCGIFLGDDTMESAEKAISEFCNWSDEDGLSMGRRGRQFAEDKLGFDLFRDRLRKLAQEAVEMHRGKS